MNILTICNVHRLHQKVQDALQGGNMIGDWYFLKERMVILRYGYFETTIVLPKFVTPLLYSLEMGRQICVIETRYRSGGNFKLMIKMLVVAYSFTFLKVECKEDLSNVLIQNFKLEKLELPWMYDLVGEFSRIVKVNKKCPTFNHKS